MGARARRCTGLLICPICADPLEDGVAWMRCSRRHSFDRAKEGYVHLLPAGHGRSKLEGDTRAMVRARRRFLGRGHYAPLSDAINAAALAALHALAPTTRPIGVVDAGCGEGYYLGRLVRTLTDGPRDRGGCFVGVDVSKAALRVAARTHPNPVFLVNDVGHKICVADAVADVLLNVFAPRNAAEFARIVRPGGALLVAIPAPAHLRELRERLPLLEMEDEKRERTEARFADAFALEGRESVRHDMELIGEEVEDLLRMTPNSWHLKEETLADVRGWGPVAVTNDVQLLMFRRRAPSP